MLDPDKQREFAVEVVRQLRERGFEAYWAGGCVRDRLLGRKPKDYDVGTTATPQQIQKVFAKRKTVAIGAQFGVIAVHFADFTDGRGYSLARNLRERHGFRGELRAVGDVRRDQLYYLAACGFDAFVLRDGEDAHAALAALEDFSDAYQSSVARPNPLFRRRLSGAHA